MEVKQYQLVRTRSLKDIVNVRIAYDNTGFAYRCTCGQCEPMPTERECVCCREIHQVENKLMEWDGSSVECITEHGGFQSVCLDIWVLQTALYQTRQEHGRSATSGPVHKLAYSPRLFKWLSYT